MIDSIYKILEKVNIAFKYYYMKRIVLFGGGSPFYYTLGSSLALVCHDLSDILTFNFPDFYAIANGHYFPSKLSFFFLGVFID